MPSTAEFSPLQRGASFIEFAVPVKTGVKIYAGTLVGVDASGYLVPASAATTKARAVAQETVDNVAGASGAKSALVRTEGFWRVLNSTANPALITHVGATLKIATGLDETVTFSGSGAASAIDAGVLAQLEVDAGVSYCWIKITW
jgi:hypothetical protein